MTGKLNDVNNELVSDSKILEFIMYGVDLKDSDKVILNPDGHFLDNIYIFIENPLQNTYLIPNALNTFFLNVDLHNALVFPFYIILLGILGIVFCKNKGFILLLLFMEMLLLGLSISFITISFYNQDPLGHVYVLMMLTLAAGESVIGLSIILKYYFETKLAYTKDLHVLRG